MLTGIKAKKLTYHHLEKREHGGPATVLNGALLLEFIHSWLHCAIELHNKELYDLIIECLHLYKQCLSEEKYHLISQYQNECMPLFQDAMHEYQYTKKRRKKK